MTGSEKEQIYSMLQTVSSWCYGYRNPVYAQKISFEDDVMEEVSFNSEENFIKKDDTETAVGLSEEIAANVNETSSSGENNNRKDNSSVSEKFRTLGERVSECKNCILSRTRLNGVFGEGCENPLVLVCGDAPGAEDDASGKCFSGESGVLLDKMLGAINLYRKTNVYVTNLVKCRPPMNRSPMTDEISGCLGYLQSQINALKPKYILAFGRSAIQTFANSSEGLAVLRGKWFEYNSIPVLATYHPSELLRDSSKKIDAWNDLKIFRSRLLKEFPDYGKQGI